MKAARRAACAFAIASALAAAGCSQSDRNDTNASVNAAASDAAAVAHTVASDAANAISPSALASAKAATNGAVSAIRSGAGQAERAVDDAVRQGGPPAKNFAKATAVKAKLVAIDAASGYATNVVAAGDDVRLTGKVASASLVARFQAAAAGVPGVKRVETHLAIDKHLPNPAQPASDLALAAEVRANLAAAGGLPTADLDVQVRDGNVTLAGTVANAATRATLEKAARDTPGVTRLDDTLSVR